LILLIRDFCLIIKLFPLCEAEKVFQRSVDRVSQLCERDSHLIATMHCLPPVTAGTHPGIASPVGPLFAAHKEGEPQF